MNAAVSCFLALAAGALAAQEQAPPRTLAQIRLAMTERFQAAQAAEDRAAATNKVLADFAAELEAFLAHEAKGDDVFNGRLLLADTYLNMRAPAKAKAALAALDAEKAPAMALIAAAELATTLGMDEQRRAWIDAAIGRPAPFEERMAVAMHLLTSLREVEKGEKIFADAFAAAADDEERARVRWYQVAALREREDRPDDAYFTELEKMAKECEGTFWGGIARDRVESAKHEVGKPPVPLTLTTTDGKEIRLADFRGKVLLLHWWAAWSDRARPAVEFVKGLHAAHAGEGLAIVGISLDDDRAQHASFVREHAIPWPQVCDGKGWLTHAALRHNIEAVPQATVIDKEGRIAGMNLLTSDPRDQKRIEEIVRRELGR